MPFPLHPMVVHAPIVFLSLAAVTTLLSRRHERTVGRGGEHFHGRAD